MKMKVYKSKSLLLLLLLFSAVNFSVSAQDARKEYTENYAVNKGVTLDAETRYSDVEIVTWDRNEVDILAVVEVDASSKSRADAALEKINIEINKSGNTISLETELENGWSRNVKTEIRITVKAPAYLNLTIENSYGDLFIQELSGLALLDLQYSNLKADKLSRGNEKPYNQLELAYSNATIEEAGWMELEMAYSDVEINSSAMLFVESKYSKLLGDRAGGIITEGAYDKYYIDELDSFVAELKYSGLKFEQVNKTLNIHASYTNTKVLKLSKSFDEVEVSLAYGNLNMTMEPGASYKIDSESRYGSIKVAGGDNLSKSKETTTTKVWGTVGSNPKGNMNLITKYGNIEID
jgi:hypothetical protein